MLPILRLSSTIKSLQTTLKQNATLNKNAILETLENSADKTINELQEHLDRQSTELSNVKNTIFEAIKNQSNIQAQLRVYNDDASKAHLATQNIVHDTLSGVSTILEEQKALSNKIDILNKEQQAKIQSLTSWFGDENTAIKDILKQQDATYVENIANLSTQAKAANDDLLQKITTQEKTLEDLRSKTQQNFSELNYADLLHDSITQSSWLKDKSFSLFGWAANYSFIYTLYRILDKVNPQNILEMGLGQTTKLTSQYIAYKNPQAELDVCEHSQEWIDIYKTDLPTAKNIKINHFDLEYFEYDGKQNDKYAGLTDFVGNKKFDIIIVDGPVGGGKNLPRSNILDLVQNNNLAENFIIIFDDAERMGEKTTIAKTKELLKTKNIEFFSFERNGIKRQHIITSKSKAYITDNDLIKTAASFGFAKKKVAAIIEQTNDALANYGKYMKELGVK